MTAGPPGTPSEMISLAFMGSSGQPHGGSTSAHAPAPPVLPASHPEVKRRGLPAAGGLGPIGRACRLSRQVLDQRDGLIQGETVADRQRPHRAPPRSRWRSRRGSAPPGPCRRPAGGCRPDSMRAPSMSNSSGALKSRRTPKTGTCRRRWTMSCGSARPSGGFEDEGDLHQVEEADLSRPEEDEGAVRAGVVREEGVLDRCLGRLGLADGADRDEGVEIANEQTVGVLGGRRESQQGVGAVLGLAAALPPHEVEVAVANDDRNRLVLSGYALLIGCVDPREPGHREAGIKREVALSGPRPAPRSRPSRRPT